MIIFNPDPQLRGSSGLKHLKFGLKCKKKGINIDKNVFPSLEFDLFSSPAQVCFQNTGVRFENRTRYLLIMRLIVRTISAACPVKLNFTGKNYA